MRGLHLVLLALALLSLLALPARVYGSEEAEVAAEQAAEPATQQPPAEEAPEDPFAEAERKRAATPPEEIERQLKENTIMDADLLPTLPPEKNYVPSGEPEFALLISPGRGLACNLKKTPNLIDFLRDEAKYYPNLLVDYIIAGDPKLKFYRSKEHMESSIVHGEVMSEEDILSLLRAGPDESREPLQSFELKDNPEVKEIMHWLERHNVARAAEPDEEHSSQLIFKPDFVPEID